jgi:hypothetical protein
MNLRERNIYYERSILYSDSYLIPTSETCFHFIIDRTETVLYFTHVDKEEGIKMTQGNQIG